MTDEEEINAAWFGVEYVRSRIGAEHDFVRFLDEDGEVAAHVTGHAKEAAEFTRARLEEIRLVTYELSLMRLVHSTHVNQEWKNPHDWDADKEALERVISREQQALDALKKGMKTEAQK